MKRQINAAFERKIVVVALENLVSNKDLPSRFNRSKKYIQIRESIRNTRLVEPLAVYPQGGKKKAERFLLLDGHYRLEALKELGYTEIECLVSTSDEAFNYNRQINRLSSIQEHRMILEAIKDGIPEEKIAKTLNVNVEVIRKKRDLLRGICPEAVEILSDKQVPAVALNVLRKAKPIGQISIAEKMHAMRDYTQNMAELLLASLPSEQVIGSESDHSQLEEMKSLECELEYIRTKHRLLEEEHGKNMLNRLLILGHLKHLLANGKVVLFIQENFPHLIEPFQKIIRAASLEE